MKKVLLVTIMIFSVVILSGCFKKDAKEQEERDLSQGATSVQEMKSEMERAMEMIRSGKKVKCEYVVQSEGQETKMTTFVEGKKYRTQMALGGLEVNSVFDGDTIYSWNKGESAGTKMNLECQREFGGEVVMEESQDAVVVSENVETVFEGAFNVSCKKVSEIDFSVPNDVNFVDQCEMLKKQQEMIEEMYQNQEGLPSIPDIPSY
jgi:hypothetical protein